MRISKSFIALLGTMGLLLTMNSCKEWGDVDDPAGNQVYPVREPVGTISLKGIADIADATAITATSGTAAIVYDADLYQEVLELKQGTATLKNPLTNAKLQTGAGISLWARLSGTNNGSLLTFSKSDGQKVAFSTDGTLHSTTSAGDVAVVPAAVRAAEGEEVATEMLPSDQWVFLAIQLNNNGCIIFADGKEFAKASYAKDQELVSVLNTAEDIIIGDEDIDELRVEKIGFTRNTMNASDVKRPNVTKVVTLPDPVYFCDFSSTEGLTIVGAGQFTTDSNDKFGEIFQNKASSAPRQNYLLLPSHILSHSAETQQMTIGFWVNASNAGTSASYNWAPMFMAYGAAPVNGENGMPMFACQYRGVLQINNAGWTNYIDVQNVDGQNHLYHNDTNADWLVDHEWHYYTVVFDGENAKVYFDGEVKNEWNMDGVNNTQKGLYTNGGDLKYICLGGNQAWNWGDNDPGFAFDDVVVYDQALTEEQLQKIISDKSGGGGGIIPTDLPEPYYRNTFESEEDQSLTIVGGGAFVAGGDKHGTIFQNETSSAPRSNYLLLPEDLLSHSADTKQLTVSFWVNAANAGESATYMWAPLFMAYGAKNNPNTWPMLACQYRGVLQLNCAGFTDCEDAQNTAGHNTLYHGETDWLADGEWHLYTVVFNGENAKVYFDGVLKNEWDAGKIADRTQAGLYSNGGDLKYICLGGNQAWDWGDNDPGFAFDDICCFNVALSAAQIKALMSVYE